jgi:hypothetical protein
MGTDCNEYRVAHYLESLRGFQRLAFYLAIRSSTSAALLQFLINISTASASFPYRDSFVEYAESL